MNYIELKVTALSSHWVDILVAVLAEYGAESFLTEDKSVKAYFQNAAYSSEIPSQLLEKYEEYINPKIDVIEILPQNWNKIWEDSIEPLPINNDILVRTSFHQQDDSYKLNLIIQPQMSFGTGHHPTTFQLLEEISKVDFHRKSVFDYGAGTGILAIYASIAGAETIIGCDIEPNCIDNANENCQLNYVDNVTLYLGNIDQTPFNAYDIVIANITRNIIESNLGEIAKRLKPKGQLFTSGYFISDLKQLELSCQKHNLNLYAHREQNSWCVAQFIKSA
ncbi:MAG: 50S ribosomal protein L11 methyltransferase [Bacteroidota bacterium]|nr:50S ribosomal protein L11 methyltransferase [Bacteroidota bacterium]